MSRVGFAIQFLMVLMLSGLLQFLTATRVLAAASETDLILLDARAMTSSEDDRSQALARLKKRPRPQVITALKDLLGSNETRRSSLSAISAMDMTEMLPDLRALSQKEDDWHVFATVNHLLSLTKNEQTRADFSKVYSVRLRAELSSPSKMAVLDGLSELKTPISEKLFQQLLRDESGGVHEAAVKQFFSTRAILSPVEQNQRLRESFRAKPYQTRLLAMTYFLNLSTAERNQYRGAIDKNLCQTESKKQVKPVCEKILKDLKSGGKS